MIIDIYSGNRYWINFGTTTPIAEDISGNNHKNYLHFYVKNKSGFNYTVCPPLLIFHFEMSMTYPLVRWCVNCDIDPDRI